MDAQTLLSSAKLLQGSCIGDDIQTSRPRTFTHAQTPSDFATRRTVNEPATYPSEQVLPHTSFFPYEEATIGLCYLDTDLRYVHIK